MIETALIFPLVVLQFILSKIPFLRTSKPAYYIYIIEYYITMTIRSFDIFIYGFLSVLTFKKKNWLGFGLFAILTLLKGIQHTRYIIATKSWFFPLTIKPDSFEVWTETKTTQDTPNTKVVYVTYSLFKGFATFVIFWLMILFSIYPSKLKGKIFDLFKKLNSWITSKIPKKRRR